MRPSAIKFWRFFVRQAKGILSAFEQYLNEVEREQAIPARLTPDDLAAIEKIVTVHYDDGQTK